MNFFQKITLGTKVLFGGFEAATDYLLKFLNEYLARAGVKDKTEKVADTVRWCSDKLAAYGWLCPAKWANDYKRVVECVAQLACALEDGQITSEELGKCREYFTAVYTEWQKD